MSLRMKMCITHCILWYLTDDLLYFLESAGETESYDVIDYEDVEFC